MVNGGELVCDKTAADDLRGDLVCMTEKLTVRAKSELSEDEMTRTQSLMLLRSMLKEEGNLRWQEDDLFLLAFLRARKFDVKRAFNLIKRLYVTFGKHSRVYYTLTFDHIRSLMEENCFDVLPQRHDDGSIIVIFRFSTWNCANFSAEERLVMVSLGLLHALRNPSTQIAGVRMIADFKGFTFNHFLQASPSNIFFLHEIIQNAIPFRVQSIHITNQNVFFPYMWSIFQNFLTKKLRERIHIHGNDMKSLHKFINPEILPADFDGARPQFDNTEWRKAMEASFDYTKHILSHGYEKYLKKYGKHSTDSIKSNHTHK